MSRLAIQISVAAVFLTTVVSATKDSISAKMPMLNPFCTPSFECENESQHCIQIRLAGYQDTYLTGICFDKIKPSGEKTVDGKPVHRSGEIMSQAYLKECSVKYITPSGCERCCPRAYVFEKNDFLIEGKMHGESCLCMAIRQ